MSSFLPGADNGPASLEITEPDEDRSAVEQDDDSELDLLSGSLTPQRPPGPTRTNACLMPGCQGPAAHAVMVILDGDPHGWLLCDRHFSHLQHVLADGVVPWIEVASVRTVQGRGP